MNDESTPKGAHETAGRRSETRIPATWLRRVRRRCTSRDLSALLGRPTRPDVAEAYPSIRLQEVS